MDLPLAMTVELAHTQSMLVLTRVCHALRSLLRHQGAHFRPTAAVTPVRRGREEGLAGSAWQGSTRQLQDPPCAATVRRTPMRLLGAHLCLTALAILVTRVSMEARALRVWQGSTRFKQDQQSAATAVSARTPQ